MGVITSRVGIIYFIIESEVNTTSNKHITNKDSGLARPYKAH